VAEADEFAVDASVSPGRVLVGEAHDQASQLGSDWRSAWASLGALGPVSGDSSAVPSQQGFGCHDPAVPEPAGECRSDRAEQAAVVVGDHRSVDLATKNAQLVAEHDDLEFVRAPGPDGETCQSAEESVQDAKHGAPGWRHRPWSAPTRGYSAPTGWRSGRTSRCVSTFSGGEMGAGVVSDPDDLFRRMPPALLGHGRHCSSVQSRTTTGPLRRAHLISPDTSPTQPPPAVGRSRCRPVTCPSTDGTSVAVRSVRP
jgi:hypothetical protein